MTACLFCKIVSGAIPCARVYEDNDVLAFLDINPLAPGHTLVIPKRHAVRTDEMDAKAVGILFTHAAKIAKAASAAVGRKDNLIALHNGPEAGQEVPHVHIHVVPRSKTDAAGPVHALFTKRSASTKEDLPSLAAKIQAHMR
jgi:histidine triad (HIT) family protein